MCQHEHQYNTNSDQDEEALQDKLESPLVLNLDELNRLKGKRMRERSNEEDTAHLEDQVYPGDAQADEGALNEVAHPHQAELEDCYHKGRRVSKGFNAQYGNTLIIKILSNRGNNKILTAIFTTLVRARTRTVSKKVKRFLLVGRVVMKKLTRATQHKLEANKESRQRRNFTTAIFVFNQGTELVFAGFLTLVILQFVLARALLIS